MNNIVYLNYIIFMFVALCAIVLNRWRGTGEIITFKNPKIININISFEFINKILKTDIRNFIFYHRIDGVTGTLIYAFYTALIFGYISEWYIGIFSFFLFLLAESMGWGKWLGALTYPENINFPKVYNDLEGHKFPFIHQIANFIVKEKNNYIAYCNIALGIRGLWWGLILMFGLLAIGHINCIEYLLISFIYGISFPVSCYLATKFTFTFNYKYLDSADKWGTAEMYYGFVHSICIFYLLLKLGE